MMSSAWSSEFKNQSLFRLRENTPRIAQCLEVLTEEEVWLRPNASSNSVGNLMLHLCGNIRQYVVSGVGRQPDTRTRDAEFSATEGLTKAELLGRLESTLREAEATIEMANEETLLTERRVQGFQFSGMGLIIHAVEHYSYHTGQIAFWTKLLRDRDLGFYATIDLNISNES